MSRTTPTTLCNLCMVEDLENGKLQIQNWSQSKTGHKMRAAATSSFATKQQNSQAS